MPITVDAVTIWRSGQKRGVTQSIRKAIHRRSAVEPAIGHMKNEGKLRRNWLKGSLGDALNAVLCGAGHNLLMILRAIRLFYAWIQCFSTADTDRRQSPRPEFRHFAML
jgi:IS5 family transposase